MDRRRVHKAVAVAVLLAVAALSLSGCGRFARKGATVPESEHVSVGADLDLSDITTTSAPEASPDPAAPASVQPAARANPVTITADGFTVTLGVDGGTIHKADQPFSMTLQVENVSGQDRHYDPNQRTYFVMQSVDGDGSWRDSDCGPGKGSGEQAKLIRAGETVTITARYPGPADRLDNSEACRRLPSTYALVAGFVWCPDDALFGGICDPSASRTITSGTVALDLT